MPTDRRRFLLGVATTAAVSVAGCSGGDEDEPRPPREDDDGEGNGDTQNGLQGTAITRTVDALKPEQVSWEDRENEDGNLTLVVVLNNINPRPIEGTMKATFATTDGDQMYTESFTLSEDGQEVTMDIPVSYEEYESNMSLPEFSFEDVTEQSS